MVKHLVTAFLFTGTALFSIDIAYAADGNGYDILPTLGGNGSGAFSISSDGSVVVGNANLSGGGFFATRWDLNAGTLQNLGTLNGGSSSSAYGVSGDGQVVVGFSNDSNAGGIPQAFRWTNATNTMVSLGALPGGTFSVAYGVNGDGSVVVGYSLNGNSGRQHAFRWTEATGTMSDLGVLNNGSSSVAHAVSADGSVIVGDAADGNASNNDRAFRWDSISGTMTSLGTLVGDQLSYARGVNADGSVVVGWSVGINSIERAYRWTQASNMMVDLNPLNPGLASRAFAVNADGSVVVGEAAISNVGTRAFRWTEDTGLISIEDWLRAAGVPVASDFTLVAEGVSADGNVVVGVTQNNSAFIARVSSVGSGIIDVNEFYASLANKPSANVGLNYAGTILNGAHGEPMRNLLQAGQQSLWVTSDIGYDNGSASDGAFGVADFGYGLGLEGGGTARFAFGGLYTDQDIDAGGNFINKGFYLAPELTLPVAGNLYATIGGYYAPGKLTVNRGYLNGGVMDYSMGEADLDTWAAKLRLDWLNAATINDWNLTPYASLTYAHSKLDAYSETGGGFPASFDAVKDHSTVIRAGVDGVHRLDNNIRLLARAEAAYRFEDEAAATSGIITGLSGFNFAGQNTNQFWLRGGLGAEMDVAGGTASLNVNVTTQGDDPTVWIRSGWKVTF
ncbi:putative HAF family extracellular repeat protein [Rhizobium sp. BIGb0125]|uniref:autotransporter domain-containing protein n=1 Tax=Rhizobium sp. BIGb0125 TaxID=2940618 RepID=UPI00216A9F13|nr:autotransporter domain-containing protein [Rhizobium sp. BIGb0125]MCS4242566.1 putative HAF family extracellular repeat protein [Rhizobium sp. BIGb0125]